MNRRTLLTLSIAVLFGLSAPLCALACLAGGVESISSNTASMETGTPCHGAGAPTPSPDEPASESDCGCDALELALTKIGSMEIAAPPTLAATIPLRAPSFVLPPKSVALAARLGREELPLPDILLRTSILLI